jgi:hypothetical protein
MKQNESKMADNSNNTEAGKTQGSTRDQSSVTSDEAIDQASELTNKEKLELLKMPLRQVGVLQGLSEDDRLKGKDATQSAFKAYRSLMENPHLIDSDTAIDLLAIKSDIYHQLKSTYKKKTRDFFQENMTNEDESILLERLKAAEPTFDAGSLHASAYNKLVEKYDIEARPSVPKGYVNGLGDTTDSDALQVKEEEYWQARFDAVYLQIHQDGNCRRFTLSDMRAKFKTDGEDSKHEDYSWFENMMERGRLFKAGVNTYMDSREQSNYLFSEKIMFLGEKGEYLGLEIPFGRREVSTPIVPPADSKIYELMAIQSRKKGMIRPVVFVSETDPIQRELFVQRCLEELTKVGYELEHIKVPRDMVHLKDRFVVDKNMVVEAAEMTERENEKHASPVAGAAPIASAEKDNGDVEFGDRVPSGRNAELETQGDDMEGQGSSFVPKQPKTSKGAVKGSDHGGAQTVGQNIQSNGGSSEYQQQQDYTPDHGYVDHGLDASSDRYADVDVSAFFNETRQEEMPEHMKTNQAPLTGTPVDMLKKKKENQSTSAQDMDVARAGSSIPDADIESQNSLFTQALLKDELSKSLSDYKMGKRKVDKKATDADLESSFVDNYIGRSEALFMLAEGDSALFKKMEPLRVAVLGDVVGKPTISQVYSLNKAVAELFSDLRQDKDLTTSTIFKNKSLMSDIVALGVQEKTLDKSATLADTQNLNGAKTRRNSP